MVVSIHKKTADIRHGLYWLFLNPKPRPLGLDKREWRDSFHVSLEVSQHADFARRAEAVHDWEDHVSVDVRLGELVATDVTEQTGFLGFQHGLPTGVQCSRS